MASLAELLQGLPPELFDIIKDFTFTATQKAVVVDQNYKPPTSLQVSRATREQYAESYYSHATTFEFTETKPFAKCFSKLSDAHCKLISKVWVTVPPRSGHIDEHTRAMFALSTTRHLGRVERLESEVRLLLAASGKLPWLKHLLRMNGLEFVYSSTEYARTERVFRIMVGLHVWLFSVTGKLEDS